MKNNELRVIVKAYNDEPIKTFAPKVGMSKNTVTKLIAKAGIPRKVKLETLDKLAAYFGYEVQLRFVIKGTGDNGTN